MPSESTRSSESRPPACVKYLAGTLEVAVVIWTTSIAPFDGFVTLACFSDMGVLGKSDSPHLTNFLSKNTSKKTRTGPKYPSLYLMQYQERPSNLLAVGTQPAAATGGIIHNCHYEGFNQVYLKPGPTRNSSVLFNSHSN